jgi:hypothetical protein
MMLELLLPILPQAFPNQFGGEPQASTEKKQEPLVLALVDPLSINWHVLMDFFPSNTAAHMKAYVRLCSVMLAKNPVDRPTAHELLLDATFSFVTTSRASSFDPITKVNLVMRGLASSRQEKENPILLDLPLVSCCTNLTEQDTAVYTILDTFPKYANQLHAPMYIKGGRSGGAISSRKPLSELMETFFEVIVLPRYGFFTQNITIASEKSHDDFVDPKKCFVPISCFDDDDNMDVQKKKKRKKHFFALGLMMAKCLIEGIRIPLQLNSACLDFILGGTTTTKHSTISSNVDDCLSLLSETDANDTILYRNLLSTRQNLCPYPFEVSVLTSKKEDTHVLTDENKASVICQVIWQKLVWNRLDCLEFLQEGFSHLRMYQDLQALSGKDLQLLFHGNDFVQVQEVLKVLVFSPDTWSNVKVFTQVKTWFHQWLNTVSDLTLRLLLFRCHGGHFYTKETPLYIVQSPDENVHVRSSSGMIQIPANCPSYESFEKRIRDELFLSTAGMTKTEAAKRQELNQQELSVVVEAMRGDIRVGGWYRCQNGHLYAIGNCGGAMERSICPECGASIGGEQHRLEDTNTHANVDGSTQAAWPPRG